MYKLSQIELNLNYNVYIYYTCIIKDYDIVQHLGYSQNVLTLAIILDDYQCLSCIEKLH